MRTALGVALVVVVAGCSSTPATTTQPQVSFVRPAAEYAASAERALLGTAFEPIGVTGLADLIVGLCEGLGTGSINVAIDDLNAGESEEDRVILTEVVELGLAQTCPDRVPIDLTSIYVDAVQRAVDSGGGRGAFSEPEVIGAAPVVCASFDEGWSGVDVLLKTVEALFGIQATSIDELADAITSDQGIVAGAVLSVAASLLCPEYVPDVTELMESL